MVKTLCVVKALFAPVPHVVIYSRTGPARLSGHSICPQWHRLCIGDTVRFDHNFGHVRMAWCNQRVLLLPQWQQLLLIQTAMRTGVTLQGRKAGSR